MTFPVVAGTNNSQQASGTTHTVSLPASISAGDRLVMCIGGPNVAITWTTPTGWTELIDDWAVNAGLTIYERIADGSEGASVNVTSSGATTSAHLSLRITGAHASQAIEVGTTYSSGGSSTHNAPASGTASWGAEDNLFISVMGFRTVRTTNTYPYADNNQSRWHSGGGNNGGIAVCTDEIAAASNDPGNYTLSGSTNAKGLTLVLRPSAGVTHYTLTADKGDIAINGQTATLSRTNVLQADQGLINLSGQANNMLKASILPADQGTIDINGQDAVFLKGITLVAEHATIAINGQVAGLVPAYKVTADFAQIDITGLDADMTHAIPMAADFGLINLTGFAAQRGYGMVSDYGEIDINGQSNGLTVQRRLTAEHGVIDINGQDANLFLGAGAAILVADSAGITVTGFDAGLTARRFRRPTRIADSGLIATRIADGPGDAAESISDGPVDGTELGETV